MHLCHNPGSPSPLAFPFLNLSLLASSSLLLAPSFLSSYLSYSPPSFSSFASLPSTPSAQHTPLSLLLRPSRYDAHPFLPSPPKRPRNPAPAAHLLQTTVFCRTRTPNDNSRKDSPAKFKPRHEHHPRASCGFGGALYPFYKIVFVDSGRKTHSGETPPLVLPEMGGARRTGTAPSRGYAGAPVLRHEDAPLPSQEHIRTA